MISEKSTNFDEQTTIARANFPSNKQVDMASVNNCYSGGQQNLCVGILYVGMAKYAVLWKDFYLSSEKYFLPTLKKHYFVFTDEDEKIGNHHNVTIYHTESLGNWVQNAMFRFQAFLDHQKDFEICDYVYFFNANILFKRKVHVKEFVPTEKDGYLLALAPTLYRGHHKDIWPYERRPESQAFIPYGQGNYYFQSAVFGGRFKEFATLCKTCYDWIQIDAKNNVIARIVDES
ncbi:MAG: hypothetical protein LBQ08_04805, partial [Holosporaceae bacterium]|nr:hypothetical protein [Holosporaceae bacterium]